MCRFSFTDENSETRIPLPVLHNSCKNWPLDKIFTSAKETLARLHWSRHAFFPVFTMLRTITPCHQLKEPHLPHLLQWKENVYPSHILYKFYMSIKHTYLYIRTCILYIYISYYISSKHIHWYNHFEVWHGVQWQGVKTLVENRKQLWHALTATDRKAKTVLKSNQFILAGYWA